MKGKGLFFTAMLVGIALFASTRLVGARTDGVKTQADLDKLRAECQADCGHPCSQLRPAGCDARLTCINTCNELFPSAPSTGNTR